MTKLPRSRRYLPLKGLSYPHILRVFCPNACPPVVLAKAGTHTPRPLARLRRMGPGSAAAIARPRRALTRRGLRGSLTPSPSAYALTTGTSATRCGSRSSLAELSRKVGDDGLPLVGRGG